MFIHEAIVFNNYSYKYYKTRLIRSRHRRTTREIVKGFNQKETKQGASKWIKVTWLKWPLHINVTSVINNFGGKHIQLPAHWSPFAPETANSHGVTGCEYHLTVVLPCVGLLALSVQKCWSWLLSPIKRVEAIAALCKIPDNSPPPPCAATTTTSPLCLLQCWSESPDFQSRDLAVTASDDRGSGEIAPGTPKEARVSGGRGARPIPTTQGNSLQMCHCSEKSPPNKRLL